MSTFRHIPIGLALCAAAAAAQPAPAAGDRLEIGGVSYAVPAPPGFLREDGLFPEFETQVITRTSSDMKLIESFLPAAHVIKGREANWQWRSAQLSFDTVYMVMTLFSTEYMAVDPVTFAAIKKTARGGFDKLASQPAVERDEMGGTMKIRIGPASLVGELTERTDFLLAVIDTPVQRSVDGVSDSFNVIDARAVVLVGERAFYLQSFAKPKSIEERLRFRDNMQNWVESVIAANAVKR